MSEPKYIEVGGRIHSIATGNVTTGANEIFDDEKNKKQNEINTETYSLVNNINERLNSLSPDQQSALSVATKATNNEIKLGYYVCETEGDVATKVIAPATGYVLSTGGSIKVKMTNANTAADATLNINSTGAKPLYYDGERVSANNSWMAGETVEVYYDGTSYYANNVTGSSGSGDAFDVSVKYPTSGIEGGNTYTLQGALAVLNTNLSANKKKGGMNIKFVQSSDNKYVCYMLKKPTWTTDTLFWEKLDLEDETELLSQDIQNNKIELELATHKSIQIKDFFSNIYYDGSKVAPATDSYKGFLFSPDVNKIYTFGDTSHILYCFNSLPKINDTADAIIANVRTISNIGYPYIIFSSSLSTSETLQVSDSVGGEVSEIKSDLNAVYSKSDILTGATIKAGWYNSNGTYNANEDYSSIEIDIDNSVNLNKVSVGYTIFKAGTSTVPHVIFFNGSSVISYYYGSARQKYVKQIPFGTTKIAFNLLTDYTASRGDSISLISTELLQHVAGTITQMKTQTATQFAAVNESIGVLENKAKSLDYYSEYKEVSKTTIKNRISVWIDDSKNIQSNSYQLRIDFTHPSEVTSFTLFKATTSHGGLESLGTFLIGRTYTIAKDSAKPVLYLYNSSVSDTDVSSYSVNALMFVINDDGVKYQSNLLYGNSIAGKKIVVFGDSLSEFTDANGKSWSQHLHELTNANVISLAIGGTQLRQRRALVKAFSEDVIVNVGDWVFNKPSGATMMNCYECIIQHIGPWDASHFTELSYDIDGVSYTTAAMYSTLDIVNMVMASTDIDTPISNRFINQIAAAQCIRDHFRDNNIAIVNQMPEIDWSEVDAVIVLGGTNDYGDIGWMGTTGSSDKNKTLGAINEIVRMLCSTYKQLSLYYVTPVVHWYEYKNGVGDVDNWCDKRNPPAMGMTRGTYYQQLQEEFLKNHIPGLNLYYELGWNIYNFSDYFYSDGTHPTKGLGFYMMAKKIASFLAGNKAF